MKKIIIIILITISYIYGTKNLLFHLDADNYYDPESLTSTLTGNETFNKLVDLRGITGVTLDPTFYSALYSENYPEAFFIYIENNIYRLGKNHKVAHQISLSFTNTQVGYFWVDDDTDEKTFESLYFPGFELGYKFYFPINFIFNSGRIGISTAASPEIGIDVEGFYCEGLLSNSNLDLDFKLTASSSFENYLHLSGTLFYRSNEAEEYDILDLILYDAFWLFRKSIKNSGSSGEVLFGLYAKHLKLSMSYEHVFPQFLSAIKGSVSLGVDPRMIKDDIEYHFGFKLNLNVPIYLNISN